MKKIVKPKTTIRLPLQKKSELPMVVSPVVVSPVRIQCERCRAFFPSKLNKPEAIPHECEEPPVD
ncbi:MAG: hypothetical protein F3740_12085 [Nitrospinae bacterium]|nr:hypothetical protein [Nitrospinota bacterium]